ncbi:MAG: VWA domain-containing protein [Aristaeellaceae bacterium]
MNRTMTQLLLTFIFVLTMLITPLCAHAAPAFQGTASGMDVVVLLDQGFSLTADDNPTDPQGYRFDAAAALLSMLNAEQTMANYAPFNTSVLAVNGRELTAISQKQGLILHDISLPLHRTKRISLLNELLTSYALRSKRATGSTDIGQALQTAVNALLQDSNGHDKVIVLFTDGSSYYVRNANLTDKQRAKKVETSHQLAREAHSLAEQNGITIHTVLLHDTEAIGLMRDELRTEDGLFFMVTDAVNLPEAFTRIFAHEINATVQTASGFARKGADITIPIDNAQVKYLNIILPLEHILPGTLRIITPDGKACSDNDHDVYWLSGNQYAVCKIINPSKGDWQLTFDSDETGSDITAQYVLEYDMALVTSLSATEASKADTITVTAQYQRDSRTLSDADLYAIPATLILSRDGSEVKRVDMLSSESGYTCSLSASDGLGAGQYTVAIHGEGSGIDLYTGDSAFTLLNKAPVLQDGVSTQEQHAFVINQPGDDASYEVQSYSWDLSPYVYDPDGDALTLSLVSAPQNVAVAVQGLRLTVSTLENTPASEDVRVVVCDQDGQQGPEWTFHIDVTSVDAALDTIVYGPTQPVTKRNDSAVIQVQYTQHGVTLTSGAYYSFPASVTLRRGDTILCSGIPMLYDGSSAYTCTLENLNEYGTGDFVAEVHIQSGPFQRDCAPISFALVNAVPRAVAGTSVECLMYINDPEKPDSYAVQRVEYQLDDYIEDADGDTLTWSIQAADADVKASLSGSVLTIASKKNTPTTGQVVVSVTDSEGAAGPDITFHTTVISVEAVYDQYAVMLRPIDAHKNSDVAIIAYVADQETGRMVNDTYLPDSITATAAATIGEQTEVSEVVLHRQENGEYIGTFHTGQQEADYTMVACVAVGEKRIESEPLTFATVNRAPYLQTELTEAFGKALSVGSSAEIELSAYFTDPDGDSLVFDIVEEQTQGYAEVHIQGSRLVLHAAHGQFCLPAVYSFSIAASDPEGAVTVSAPIVMEIRPVRLQIALAVAAFLVIAVTVWCIQRRRKHFGAAAFDVSYGYQGLELPDGLSKCLPEGSRRPEALADYIPDLARTMCGLHISQDTLRRITLHPRAKDRICIHLPDGLDVHVYAGCAFDYDVSTKRYSGRKEIGKALSLKPGDGFTICCNERRVTFRYVRIRKL